MVYEAYNLTAMGNSTGIVQLMQTVNSELMFDFFGIGILLTIFLVTFFASLTATGGDAIKAMAASSFLVFAMSLLLMVLDLIPNYMMYVSLVITAISIIAIKDR